MDELDDLAAEWDLTLGTVSDASREVYRRAITQFGAWLAAEHPDATSSRSTPTRPSTSRCPAPTTRSCRSSKTPTWPRSSVRSSAARRSSTAAILRVLIDTGCRRGELAGIDVDDVDLRTHDIRLRRTKGGDERLVPIGGKTALALRRYLRARQRHAAAGSPALFLSIRSGDRSGWRISGGGVAEMLVRRCEAAGVPPVHPHMFRHTWANDLLSNGANEGDVEKLAGWRSPLMVRRKSHAAPGHQAHSARRTAGGSGLLAAQAT